jgi:hypothetical protein
MTARDRHVRQWMNAATPSERLAAMRLLIERSWARAIARSWATWHD